VGSGKQLLSEGGEPGPFVALTFAPDGKTLAGADEGGVAVWAVPGGKVRLWDAGAGKELARAEVDAPAWSVALAPDGRYLAAGDKAGAVKVWEVSRLLRRKGQR